MAKFEKAFAITSALEAGYTVDNGGATYNGISFKNWSNDPTAIKIAALVKKLKPQSRQVIDDDELKSLVLQFYKKNYWDRIKGDLINNQLLANFVYDFCINSGSAIILINRAVGGREVDYINETTLTQFNTRPAFCYDAIRRARKDLYVKLAKKNPVFLRNNTFNGWIARLNQFPQTLTA